MRFQDEMTRFRDGMMGYQDGWILMILAGLILIGIIVLIILMIIRITNGSKKDVHTNTIEANQSSPDRALMILAERYAKGEINDEEYRQKKSEITKP